MIAKGTQVKATDEKYYILGSSQSQLHRMRKASFLKKKKVP